MTALPSRTSVLIAGGGPVGLAAAVELGRRGIPCAVVEPREEVSRARPRCKTLNVRTMEHLRRWGIADRLRERAPLPVEWSQSIVFCTSLTGHELSRFDGVLGLAADGDRFPELGQQAPQFVLEDLLREVVDELPSSSLVRGARVGQITQDGTSVRAEITESSGQRMVVSADYLIGCDGPRSTVRDQIGAHYVGEQALRPNFGMVFTAPALAAQVTHGRAVQYWVVNERAPALLGPLDKDGTWWMIAFGVDAEQGASDGSELIDAAVGTHVDATILSTDPWTAHMQCVDHLRDGRVFLAGDAAHLNPPFGGHGLNTGIGDAVDLGWKLAAVLQGWGGADLLDSYELERRPVQERVIAEAAQNNSVLSTELTAPNLDDDDDDDEAGGRSRQAAHDRIQQTKHAEFHALDLVLDIRHDESPVMARDDTGQADLVGARLPHVWLGPGRSIYDTLGDGFTLIVLTGDPSVTAPMVDAARTRGVPLAVVDLGGTGLREHYGTDALLVRPDQYVAWHGDVSAMGVLEVGAVLDRVRGASQHDHLPAVPAGNGALS